MSGMRLFCSCMIPVLLWMLDLVSAEAQDAIDSARSQTVYLNYTEAHSKISLPCYKFNVYLNNNTFRKEPELTNHKVVRGTMQFGKNEHAYIPFLWDYSHGRLYCDLNRNQDLTDDPDGVCTNTIEESSGDRSNSQEFQNLRLSLPTEAGDASFLMRLKLSRNGNELRGSAEMLSCYEGSFSLQGKEFLLAVRQKNFDRLDSMQDSWLSLRVRDNSMQEYPDEHFGLMFKFTPRIYIYNHAFRLTCSAEQHNGILRYKVEIKDEKPVLGELQIGGNYIDNLTLENKEFKVILPDPEGKVSVPVGKYQLGVRLKHGNSKAYRHWPMDVEVKEGHCGAIMVGGPLKQSVSIKRNGDALALDYKLLGVDGEEYFLLDMNGSQDISRPPSFSVHFYGKRVASGRFEYG